ncbi:MAG: cation:proton antiporter subunit C [Candidatus Thermoplasmatota archaeon]|nr:cation:proton antiporter subunit C [Candidatus Thermoplasmatota archaeon]MDD5778963.1 cation:proton antiporter subunit C [Candidatus Thermoplasmatota archaeon]
MINNVPFFAVMLLIAIGLYTILFKRNLIKIAMGIVIVEAGVNLFLITLGYREGGLAPIYTHLPTGVEIPGGLVLPVPQALTLTSIVIGVAILALILSFVVRIYRHYETLDSRNIRRLKE